jgi:hypothetical protein
MIALGKYDHIAMQNRMYELQIAFIMYLILLDSVALLINKQSVDISAIEYILSAKQSILSHILSF